MVERARKQLRAGKPARAARLYRRAIEIDDTNEAAYVGLSTALDAESQHDDALEILDAAGARIGWSVDIAVQRGLHLRKLGRNTDSAAELARALDQEPDAFLAAYHLGLARLELQQWAEAVVAFDSYLSHRPKSLAGRDDFVSVRRAYALLGDGKLARARRALRAVLKRDADNLAARSLLFAAQAKAGRCRQALDTYAELTRAAAEAPTLLYDAAVCQYRLGRSRDALRTLGQYPAGRERPRQALLLEARIHVTLAHTEDAIAAYEKAIAAGLDATVEMATWLSSIKRYDRVVKLVWPAVDSGSRNEHTLEIAALALAEIADYERAAVASTRLLEVAPGPDAWMLHGRIESKRGNWAQAEKVFRLALDAQPRNVEARDGARLALQRQAHAAFGANRAAEARELLERALRLDPDHPDVAYNLALLRLDNGNASGAIELLAPVVDRVSNRTRALLVLGRAQMRAGNYNAAKLSLQRAAEDHRAQPTLRAQVLLHLAHSDLLGRPDVALVNLAEARTSIDAKDSPKLAAELDRAEAWARLLSAQRLVELTMYSGAAQRLAGLDETALDARARARLGVLKLFTLASKRGLVAALRKLAAIPDADLDSIAAENVGGGNLRHGVALHLGIQFMTRASDYTWHLRPHAAALSPRGSGPVLDVLPAWYDHALFLMLSKQSLAAARAIARAAPSGAQTRSFQHNAIIAAAVKRGGHNPLSRSQVRKLESLMTVVPEALTNLAVDAESKGDHVGALDYLRRIKPRTAAIEEWIQWKELLHGTP